MENRIIIIATVLFFLLIGVGLFFYFHSKKETFQSKKEMTSDDDPDRHLIAHNIGNGPVIEDMLFDFKISGHYRYQPQSKVQQTKLKKKSTNGKT